MGLDELIEEYIALPSDVTDVDGMIHLREQIAGELYHLAVQVGEARKNMQMKKAIYEGKKTQIRVTHLHEGIGKAEAISRANSSIEGAAAAEADGDFYILRYQYDSAKEILNALNQKISWLKEEAKYNRAIS